MVFGTIAKLAPILIKKGGRYIYKGLRYQERIIDATYRHTGLYNRGVVRGLKHGLAGGQIIGGGLSLGLNAPDSPGNDGIQTSPGKRTTPSKSYQTRRRFSRRCGPEYSKYKNTNYRKR